MYTKRKLISIVYPQRTLIPSCLLLTTRHSKNAYPKSHSLISSIAYNNSHMPISKLLIQTPVLITQQLIPRPSKTSPHRYRRSRAAIRAPSRSRSQRHAATVDFGRQDGLALGRCHGSSAKIEIVSQIKAL
jgi:hypothetical protein